MLAYLSLCHRHQYQLIHLFHFHHLLSTHELFYFDYEIYPGGSGQSDDELLEIMKWCSHNSFTLSFIEVMPVGEMLNSRKSQYFSVNKAKEIICKDFDLEQSSLKSSGPSNYFYCKKLNLFVGFISPISDHFCATCNRLRITSNGKVYPCLGDNNSLDLTPFIRANDRPNLLNALKKVIFMKPERHYFNIDEKSYIHKRFMNTTGG